MGSHIEVEYEAPKSFGEVIDDSTDESGFLEDMSNILYALSIDENTTRCKDERLRALKQGLSSVSYLTGLALWSQQLREDRKKEVVS